LPSTFGTGPDPVPGLGEGEGVGDTGEGVGAGDPDEPPLPQLTLRNAATSIVNVSGVNFADSRRTRNPLFG